MPSLVVIQDSSAVQSTPSIVNWPVAQDNDDDDDDAEITMGAVDNLSYWQTMNYTFALSRCATLCKTAGHENHALALVVSLIDEATKRIRSRLHINPTSNIYRQMWHP
jgi:hypothetical protein